MIWIWNFELVLDLEFVFAQNRKKCKIIKKRNASVFDVFLNNFEKWALEKIEQIKAIPVDNEPGD